MKQAALNVLELAAKEGPQDTRVHDVHLRTAQVYALLAIAEALEKLAEL